MRNIWVLGFVVSYITDFTVLLLFQMEYIKAIKFEE